MIYAGQNNGYPWGPVGENVIVHGANFAPYVQLRLVVAPGNSNSNASVCQQPGATIRVATVTSDNTGSFTQNFSWPVAANHVNQGYSICSLLTSGNIVASSHDDGPFTVLSSSPPVINISAATVVAGGTITVTGQNWVPPQAVSEIIAGCAACDPGNTYVTSANATSAGLNSGSFSVTIPIPPKTKPGNYVVDALTKTGLEAFYTTGVKHLTINAAPTIPTPTPSPTTQPSPTPSPTAQTTAVPSPTPAASVTASAGGGTVTTTNSDSSGPGSTGTSSSGINRMVILLAATVVMLFLIAAVILLVHMQRRKRGRGGANAANLPYSPGPQFGQPGQFMQSGYFNQVGMPGADPYGQQGLPLQYSQLVSAPGYELPGQQGNYPPQFASPGMSPMPQENFPPLPSPPTMQPQPARQTLHFAQSDQRGQQVGGSQLLYAQPTEAYNPYQPYDQQAPPAQQSLHQQSPVLPTCPNCGRPLVPNLPACGVCGMPLEMMSR